jgi:hypothetical protein
MQELIDEMKEETEISDKVDNYFDGIDENAELPELELTSKIKLENVQDTINNTIKSTYDYYEYSELDGSNDRFMEKQRNTNMLRDQIFNTNDLDDNINEEDTKLQETTLF